MSHNCYDYFVSVATRSSNLDLNVFHKYTKSVTYLCSLFPLDRIRQSLFFNCDRTKVNLKIVRTFVLANCNILPILILVALFQTRITDCPQTNTKCLEKGIMASILESSTTHKSTFASIVTHNGIWVNCVMEQKGRRQIE